MSHPILGIASIGHSLAMARTTTAEHAIKRIDRFLANPGMDREVAAGDLMATVIGSAASVYLTLDWMDPKTKDGRFQILSINVRAHGRAIPIAWMTVAKENLKDHMREYERTVSSHSLGGSWLCHDPFFPVLGRSRMGLDYPFEGKYLGPMGGLLGTLDDLREVASGPTRWAGLICQDGGRRALCWSWAPDKANNSYFRSAITSNGRSVGGDWPPKAGWADKSERICHSG